MATANEINQFNRCKELVDKMKLELTTNSSFKLKDPKGLFLGEFFYSKELYYYLCGYQAGFEDGKYSNQEE